MLDDISSVMQRPFVCFPNVYARFNYFYKNENV